MSNWEPLPGWFILRWMVYAVLLYLGVMIVYGTFFRSAQPWLLDALGVIGLVAVCAVIGAVVMRRRARQTRVLPPGRE